MVSLITDGCGAFYVDEEERLVLCRLDDKELEARRTFSDWRMTYACVVELGRAEFDRAKRPGWAFFIAPMAIPTLN